MGKIRKILETELVGGTQSTDVYPVTSTKAVYDTNNKVLDDYIQHLKKTSTFAGIATPTTNPGTPDGPVFYIAGEGTYANFSNIVIEAGQLGILKWNGTWSKEVLEIGAGGGGGVVDTAAITKIVNDTIKNFSWWGQKINNNKVDGNIVITKGSHSFTIELDDNGNLKFNGNIYATGGITALGVGTTTGGGSSASLGTLLTKLNSDNPFPTDNGQVLTYDGTNFVWKTPTGSGGSLNSLEVLNKDGSTFFNYNGETAYRLRFGNGLSMSLDGDEYVVKALGGSGSSSRIKKIKLFTNDSDYSFETVELGTADTIGFMAGNNVSLQAVVKEYTNVIKISATGGSGGSGGSTSTSVSWGDVTGKPSTFTPSSHTHSASDISGLSGVKVNNATNADRLLNSRTIWGQSFNGTGDINGNLKMGSAGGGSIQLLMNNGNMLDRTNNTLHIGNGLKASSDGEINLDAYVTKVYTDNMSKHYDFKSNVFDVNSNQIHFGSETNGGKISWDAANNAFKIEGNVYATGGITALGVSNNATTSNNVDFTFRNVTANNFNVMDSIQLSNTLKLRRNGDDVVLVNINSNVDPSLYLGDGQEYYIDANGIGYFSNLSCDILNIPGGGRDFKLVDVNDTGFAIQFTYNGKTYKFIPSGSNLIIS